MKPWWLIPLFMSRMLIYKHVTAEKSEISGVSNDNFIHAYTFLVCLFSDE